MCQWNLLFFKAQQPFRRMLPNQVFGVIWTPVGTPATFPPFNWHFEGEGWRARGGRRGFDALFCFRRRRLRFRPLRSWMRTVNRQVGRWRDVGFIWWWPTPHWASRKSADCSSSSKEEEKKQDIRIYITVNFRGWILGILCVLPVLRSVAELARHIIWPILAVIAAKK